MNRQRRRPWSTLTGLIIASLVLPPIIAAQGPSLSGTVEEFDKDKRILTLKTTQGVAHALSLPSGEFDDRIKEGDQVSVQLNSDGAVTKIDTDPAPMPPAPVVPRGLGQP